MKTIQYNILSWFLVLGSWILVGCDRLDMAGMFNSSAPSNNERFAQSMDYNNKHGYPVVNVPTDTYTVHFGTDFHVDTLNVRTKAWTEAVLADSACAAAFILGDMVNGKQLFPFFMEAVQPLRDANFPLFATAGNHDAYFDEWPEYIKHWGRATYYVTIQTPNYKDLYIALDSSDGTLGVDQLSWLKDLLNQAKNENYRHKIIFTHTHMFKPDGQQGHTSNYPMEETWELLDLFAAGGVEWYLSGHRHARDIRDFRGVTYYIIDAVEDDHPEMKSYYMVAHVGQTLATEFIEIK